MAHGHEIVLFNDALGDVTSFPLINTWLPSISGTILLRELLDASDSTASSRTEATEPSFRSVYGSVSSSGSPASTSQYTLVWRTFFSSAQM